MRTMLSSELLEQYKAGQRVFSGALIQFADISAQLPGIVFEKCRLASVAFTNCNLRQARFADCDIFFGSFYGGDLTEAVFDRCTIELTLWERPIVTRMKIRNSELRYSAIFNANLSDVDLSTSTQTKFFTSPSELTAQDVEAGMALLMPFLDTLEPSMKKKIAELLEQDSARYGIDAVPKPHQEQKSAYSTSPGSGYGALQHLQREINKAYHATNPYEQKKPYKERERYQG